MALLEEYEIELDGARAVVVGRSDIVGKPIAHLLLQANATVTICHSHTDDLERHTLDADVLVVAAGAAADRRAGHGQVGRGGVDVGINRTEAGLVGDVDPGAADVAALPHAGPGRRRPDDDRDGPGEHGRAARYRRGLLAFPETRTLRFAPLHSRSAARCPGRRCLLYEGRKFCPRAPSSGSRTRRAMASSSAKAAKTCSSTSRRLQGKATSR